MPCPALVVSLAFVRRFSSLRFSLPVAILGQHVQTGRPPPPKANDNGRPTKKLNTVRGLRMQAGTVAKFSVVHATVGLAQARPNNNFTLAALRALFIGPVTYELQNCAGLLA